MNKTKLEHDLATSESKRVISRKDLQLFIVILVIIIALLFLYTIFSTMYRNRERIERLETKIETMKHTSRLWRARLDQNTCGDSTLQESMIQ